MASSIFGNRNGNSAINAVNQTRSILGNNPNGALSSLYQSNPQFRQFADSMRGKTPEQAFRENGLNYDDFSHLFH